MGDRPAELDFDIGVPAVADRHDLKRLKAIPHAKTTRLIGALHRRG
jgi:hypothetical protein